MIFESSQRPNGPGRDPMSQAMEGMLKMLPHDRDVGHVSISVSFDLDCCQKKDMISETVG